MDLGDFGSRKITVFHISNITKAIYFPQASLARPTVTYVTLTVFTRKRMSAIMDLITRVHFCAIP
jgi:hypothetical protein